MKQKEYYTEEEKKEIVALLKTNAWNKCVTLTTRRLYEIPDLIGYIRNYVRRIDGVSHSRSSYFIAISGEEHDRFGQREVVRSPFTRLHCHGVLEIRGEIANTVIEGCWRSVETHFRPTADLSLSLPNTLGHSKVTNYDGDERWLYYILNQTKRGYILTNMELPL